jgi:hypothetical protein
MAGEPHIEHLLNICFTYEVQTFLMWFLGILGVVAVAAALIAKWLYLRCPGCSSFLLRSEVRNGRQDNGFQDGWRTVRESVDTDTTYFDNSYNKTGSGKSTSYVNRTVPCRTVFWTEFYGCSNCGCNWSQNFQRTFNL